MSPDDEVCYCFHVSRRKLVNFARRRKPKVPSQMSECGGAGTGCGWCIPFLKQIFRKESAGLDELTSDDYARRRAEYVRGGGGVPAPGATPLPND
jgi:NAD(P)H-nitrite reductase large subunit